MSGRNLMCGLFYYCIRKYGAYRNFSEVKTIQKDFIGSFLAPKTTNFVINIRVRKIKKGTNSSKSYRSFSYFS